MDELERQLKTLKSISPDASFVSISRAAVLNTPRTDRASAPSLRLLIRNLGLSLSVTTAAALVIVIVSSIKSADSVGSAVAGFGAVESEAATVEQDISVALKEINSFNEAGKKTAFALTEAADNGPAHLNISILNMELDNIEKVELDKKDEINLMLEKAAF